MRKQWLARTASVCISVMMALAPAAQSFAAEETSTEVVQEEVVSE